MADEVVWDALVKRSDATFKSTQRIIAFFRQFAQAESDYGKKLIASTIMMSKDGGQSLIPQEDIVHQCDAGTGVAFFSCVCPDARRTGPVILTWDTFQRQIYERGARCVKLAADVEQAMDELDGWCKDQTAVKKHMVDEVYRLKKEVGDHMSTAKRLQASQNAACAEADKIIGEMLSAGPAEKAAGKKKAKLVVERAAKCIKDYAKAVAEVNKFRTHAANRLIPDLQAEFRAVEESRLSTLKLLFGRLNVSLSCASPSNPSWSSLSKLILDLDPVAVAGSLATSVDASALRVPLEATPYDSAHPDFSKSRIARIKGEDLAASGSAVPMTLSPAAAPPVHSHSTPAPSSGGGALASVAAGEAADKRQSVEFGRGEGQHFAEVMPNSVVALGVESKREILRAQLAQLQIVILTEKRVLMDLFSLIRFYGGSAVATERAKEEYAAQKKKFSNLLGARKQVFAAMEKVGTTPSVFSTLRNRDRYAAAPENSSNLTASSSSTPVKTVSAPQAAASIVRGLCLYSYKAATAKELSFRKGDVLIVRDEDDSGWWYVENLAGDLGFVPANFLRKMAPGEQPPPPREKRKKSAAAATAEPVASGAKE